MDPMVPFITEDAAIVALRSVIPDAEWLLGKIESQQGWFRFPDLLTQATANLKIDNYPLLYLSESAITLVMLQSFMEEGEVKSLLSGIEGASLENRSEFFAEFIINMGSNIECIQIPKTTQQQEESRLLYESMDSVEKLKSIKAAQYFFSAFLAMFYQCLSIMVQGEKLTSLVSQAQAGCDKAFTKAVQIDRRILTVIPYFRDRYANAQNEANTQFFDLLSYRLSRAPYRGKIRYKSLWLSFSLLDQVGLLNTLKHREILDICNGAGVGGYKNRIDDVKNLTKRISEYRAFQNRGKISTT